MNCLCFLRKNDIQPKQNNQRLHNVFHFYDVCNINNLYLLNKIRRKNFCFSKLHNHHEPSIFPPLLYQRVKK